MESSSPESMSYFISQKEDVLIVCLQGSLIQAQLERIQQCFDEILKSEAKFVVLHFGLATEVDRSICSQFARIQKQIRENKGFVSICSLGDKIHGMFSQQGIVRVDELSRTLPEALSKIVNLRRSPKAS